MMRLQFQNLIARDHLYCSSFKRGICCTKSTVYVSEANVEIPPGLVLGLGISLGPYNDMSSAAAQGGNAPTTSMICFEKSAQHLVQKD